MKLQYSVIVYLPIRKCFTDPRLANDSRSSLPSSSADDTGSVVCSEREYRKAVAILDEIGQDEAHPLADLAEALGLFIHSYEETHAKIRAATGPEVLRSLMEAHGLTQSELPEIGSQGVVSEILSGERELNIRQIRRPAKRFGVSPTVFIGP
jgi:HTH-type transcriptional regulator/antitoxin HigA